MLRICFCGTLSCRDAKTSISRKLGDMHLHITPRKSFNEHYYGISNHMVCDKHGFAVIKSLLVIF